MVAGTSSRTLPQPPVGERGSVCTIGVLVVCYPMLHCRGRDIVTDGRYRGMSARESAGLINKEVRLISRVIVLPQWRGVGVATALVRRALEESTTVYTEALAAMGRACPFFERAGMEKLVVAPRVEQVRLRGALEEVGLGKGVLVSSRRSREVVDGCSETEMLFLEKELRVWWRSAGRVTKGEAAGLGWEELLGEARRRVWVEPWYFWGKSIHHPPEADHRGHREGMKGKIIY